MNWFEGSIPAAITAAKTGKAIFVVYVRDSSEASRTTDESLARHDIAKVLGGGGFVSIRLESGSEDAKQFSQIYPLVLIPSLFFISGETGLPMEVLGGPLSPENLKEKINKLVNVSKEANPSEQSLSNTGTTKAPEGGGGSSSSSQEEPLEAAAGPHTSTSTPVSVPSPSTEESEPNSEEATISANQTAPDQKSEESPAGTSGEAATSESASLSLDEKVERAKVLLAEKQNNLAREKAEEERQKEIARRRIGQEIAKRKQRQEDEELRAAAREMRKDKEEDRLARERVKAQIAADRAEREARAALLRGEVPPAGQEAAAAPPSVAAEPPHPAPASNTSRLKFRLPDGSSSVSQFPAEAPLSEVRQYIEQNVALPFPSFTLASTVHHGPFRAEDYTTSLRDLGLVPSAILVILPSTSASTGRVISTGGGIWDILWLLLSPISFIFNLIRQLLGGGGEHSPGGTSGEPQAKRPREDPSSNTRQRPATAYGSRGEARLRQQGNIHRLHSGGEDEDDDENNTWNGNSTQQM